MHVILGLALLSAGALAWSEFGGANPVLGAILGTAGLLSVAFGLFISFGIYLDTKR